MDPKAALILALEGDRKAAREYNAWVKGGGFRVALYVDPSTDLWMRGVRTMWVKSIGTKYVTGEHAMSGKVFRVAFSLVSAD